MIILTFKRILVVSIFTCTSYLFVQGCVSQTLPLCKEIVTPLVDQQSQKYACRTATAGAYQSSEKVMPSIFFQMDCQLGHFAFIAIAEDDTFFLSMLTADKTSYQNLGECSIKGNNGTLLRYQLIWKEVKGDKGV